MTHSWQKTIMEGESLNLANLAQELQDSIEPGTAAVNVVIREMKVNFDVRR